MAFHLHLINSMLDLAPAPAVQIGQVLPLDAPRLALSWELGCDGRPRARWTIGRP